MRDNLIVILILFVYFSPLFYQLGVVLKERKRGNLVPLKKFLKIVKYSLVILFTLIIGLAVLSHTNYLDYEKPLTFDQYEQITFENFRGLEFFKKSLYGNEQFAYVVVSIDSKFENNSVTVQSLFYPSRSFVYNQNTNSKELLTHEKYHIKIAELFSRKAKKKISELPSFDKKRINEILKQAKSDERKYQKEYDYNTFHSYVLSEQKKYEKEIDSLLDLLTKNQKFSLMPKNKFILLTILCVALTSCKTKEKHQFPLDKRYWDENDYKEVVFELNYAYDEDEKLPTFDNPQTKPIVEKLTDQQNFIVVLDDQELGLKYKNQIAEKFFKQWQEMSDIYSVTDRKDQYPYEKEFLAVWHFGLALQLKYFKLGNDYILESADDPNSRRVANKVESNVKTLIRNYLIYLDLIDHEDTFTEKGKHILSEGIDKYFAQLLKLYPDSDYSEMKQKSESMLKKSESDQIKSSLNSLIETIDQFKKAA